MARYVYTAKDRFGKTEKGTLESKSKDELIIGLQARGLIVLSVEEESAVKAVPGAPAKGIRMHSGIKLDDLILYARQLSTLLAAGIPLLRSINLLTSQISSRQLLRINEQIKADIEAGKSLKDSIARHPKIFSRFWIYLVETGELSGKLPDTLRELTAHLEAAASLRRKIVSAMIYPSIVLGASIAVISAFLLIFVPMFERVFKETGVALPALTRAIISLSNGFKIVFLPLLLVLVILVIAFKAYNNTEKGRYAIDKFKLGMPIFGMLVRMQAEVEFASGFALLLRSGVPILHALEIMGKSATNRVAGEAIDSTRDYVREGKTVAEPLAKTGIFAPMIPQMIAVGEETGELPDMLDKVSAFTKERLDTYIGRLTTMIEPAIILVLAVVVLIIAIAVYFPMFQMLTNTGY